MAKREVTPVVGRKEPKEPEKERRRPYPVEGILFLFDETISREGEECF